MEKVLDHKAVLHIPRQYWDGEKLRDLDLQTVLPILTQQLEAIGISGWYETEAWGHFSGRRYPELQITVFDAELVALEQVFYRWVRLAHSQLRQEVYAWEMDGKLVLVPSVDFGPKKD